MTDTTTETVGPDTEAEGWGADAPAVTYPEYGPLPEARISLNFTPGKAPQLTVRAHTAAELTAALQELEEGNVYNVIGVAHSSMGAQVAIGAGLGQATQVPAPQGAPAPVQPMPLPQSPQAQYPVGPPVPPQGPAPAQWQNAGAPAPPAGPQNQEYRNAGWYRLDVPFPKKGQFDGIVAQYQLRKGRPSEGGSYSFNSKGEKAWYVSPEVAGAFPMFSPVPA
jgi:hypothetical protein